MDPVSESTDRYPRMCAEEEQAAWEEDAHRIRDLEHLRAMVEIGNLAYHIVHREE